jgi:hypothetical protein
MAGLPSAIPVIPGAAAGVSRALGGADGTVASAMAGPAECSFRRIASGGRRIASTGRRGWTWQAQWQAYRVQFQAYRERRQAERLAYRAQLETQRQAGREQRQADPACLPCTARSTVASGPRAAAGTSATVAGAMAGLSDAARGAAAGCLASGGRHAKNAGKCNGRPTGPRSSRTVKGSCRRCGKRWRPRLERAQSRLGESRGRLTALASRFSWRQFAMVPPIGGRLALGSVAALCRGRCHGVAALDRRAEAPAPVQSTAGRDSGSVGEPGAIWSGEPTFAAAPPRRAGSESSWRGRSRPVAAHASRRRPETSGQDPGRATPGGGLPSGESSHACPEHCLARDEKQWRRRSSPRPLLSQPPPLRDCRACGRVARRSARNIRAGSPTEQPQEAALPSGESSHACPEHCRRDENGGVVDLAPSPPKPAPPLRDVGACRRGCPKKARKHPGRIPTEQPQEAASPRPIAPSAEVEPEPYQPSPRPPVPPRLEVDASARGSAEPASRPVSLSVQQISRIQTEVRAEAPAPRPPSR